MGKRVGMDWLDVLGASVWGPGLEGWAASRLVLAGLAPYEPRASPPPPPTILSATERRRTGPVARLALAVAHEAAAMSGLPPAGLRTVFGSANGDGLVVGGILDALSHGQAAPGERLVSPTQFHNSVHNAAAGYWSIATGSMQPATCLGCGDDTWAASLLMATVEALTTRQPVLLVVYDHPLPPPLDAARPTGPPFAAALVLMHRELMHRGGAPAIGRMVAWRTTDEAAPGDFLPRNRALARLAASNPAARSLAVLEALAARDGQFRPFHHLPYLDRTLKVRVSADLSRRGFARLVPHAGAMCLLDRIVSWDLAGIRCLVSNLSDPDNPLRHAGRLPALAGIEYAMQAAALHGALRAGGVAQPPGYAAALRDVALHADRLDDHEEIMVDARLERQEASGLIYALRVTDPGGKPLVEGRAVIALPRA